MCVLAKPSRHFEKQLCGGCAQIPTKTPQWHGSTHSLWGVMCGSDSSHGSPLFGEKLLVPMFFLLFFFLLLGACALDVYTDAWQSWSQCTHVLVQFVHRAAHGFGILLRFRMLLAASFTCCVWLLRLASTHFVGFFATCWIITPPVMQFMLCVDSRHVELLLAASCRMWFFKHQVFASLCKAKSCCILSEWLQASAFLTAWFFLPEYIVDVVVTWKML